jgi:hypothetical protein
MKAAPLNELSVEQLATFMNHCEEQFQRYTAGNQQGLAFEWYRLKLKAQRFYQEKVEQREKEQMERLKADLRGRLTPHEYQTVIAKIEEQERGSVI